MTGTASLNPGDVFARDFRILRPLSAGGMGAVYVAEQLSTGKHRALKVMHPGVVADPRHRERFAQEARVGSRIDSDHVVEIIVAGIDDATGVPYLVMELLEGRDLADLISRDTLPPDDALAIFEQLCDALGKAHRAGIVHRDLKPENIFVATSRRRDVDYSVKILDFGIATILASGRAAATVTTAIGSPLWMAPEQTSPGAHITPATDVWPLGLIAFYALTGRHYWLAANAPDVGLHALIAEIVVQPIVPASARAAALGVAGLVPPGFDPWFARCVDRAPAARFADADQAMAALRPVLAVRPAPPPAPGYHATQQATAPPPPVAFTAPPQPACSAPPPQPAYSAPPPSPDLLTSRVRGSSLVLPSRCVCCCAAPETTFVLKCQLDTSSSHESHTGRHLPITVPVCRHCARHAKAFRFRSSPLGFAGAVFVAIGAVATGVAVGAALNPSNRVAVRVMLYGIVLAGMMLAALLKGAKHFYWMLVSRARKPGCACDGIPLVVDLVNTGLDGRLPSPAERVFDFAFESLEYKQVFDAANGLAPATAQRTARSA